MCKVQGLMRATQGRQDGVSTRHSGTARAEAAEGPFHASGPDDGRLDRLTEGARELASGHEVLLGGLRQLGAGTQALQAGLGNLTDGAGRLDTGMELLRRTLPMDVDRPEGNAQGLAAVSYSQLTLPTNREF